VERMGICPIDFQHARVIGDGVIISAHLGVSALGIRAVAGKNNETGRYGRTSSHGCCTS
jgi:hypothetical protein